MGKISERSKILARIEELKKDIETLKGDMILCSPVKWMQEDDMNAAWKWEQMRNTDLNDLTERNQGGS